MRRSGVVRQSAIWLNRSRSHRNPNDSVCWLAGTSKRGCGPRRWRRGARWWSRPKPAATGSSSQALHHRRCAVVAGQRHRSGAGRCDLERLGTALARASGAPHQERSSRRAEADALIVGHQHRVRVGRPFWLSAEAAAARSPVPSICHGMRRAIQRLRILRGSIQKTTISA